MKDEQLDIKSAKKIIKFFDKLEVVIEIVNKVKCKLCYKFQSPDLILDFYKGYGYYPILDRISRYLINNYFVFRHHEIVNWNKVKLDDSGIGKYYMKYLNNYLLESTFFINKEYSPAYHFRIIKSDPWIYSKEPRKSYTPEQKQEIIKKIFSESLIAGSYEINFHSPCSYINVQIQPKRENK